MSSKMFAQSAPQVKEVMALYRPDTFFWLRCSQSSLIALVVYDWIETLPREVNLFWTGNARPLPATLYFTNKYLNLLACVVSALQRAPVFREGCVRSAIMVRVFIYLSLIPPAGFTALRAYALTRRRWLSVFVFLLCSVQIVMNMATIIWFHVFGVHSDTWGCIGGVLVLPSSPLGQTRLIVNRVTAILADTILIVITWKFLPASVVMTYHALTESWKLKGLAYVMLCNGVLYFVVLSALHVAQLVLTLGFSVVPDGLLFHVWYYTFPLSSVLVSHFILDLQEAHQRTEAGLNTDTSQISQDNGGSIQFASSLGSVGAIVGLAAGTVEEEDEDGISADSQLVEMEVMCPGEGDDTLTPRLEDELEMPRLGEGDVTAGALLN